MASIVKSRENRDFLKVDTFLFRQDCSNAKNTKQYWQCLLSSYKAKVHTSVASGSEFPVPGRFRVLQSRVRAGYGYTLKFETRVPGTLRVIGG